MDISSAEQIKEYLLTHDSEFRELAKEHGRYEARLSELTSLAYPSEEEQIEENTLKKKKLAIKDQMYEMMLRHEQSQQASH